ncbi:ROK family protein [Staphylococcus cohnii]|uniref:ROK family protein n=2 Tax=Staphylococcus cohnii TaxID=29382 RepID=A0ABT6IYM3_9STAP|nr:ROK family protein [Staphylococcus cohnii]TGP61887.1 ROK family protein [bacterium M00.F.Ca.ET.229.01.1.1]TGS38439.1 ROK family protein [bacterium M00.F.Ca.ET.180.01.1.1]AYX90715.1 ROK family protein [Staphylococcus cohnii]KKI65477.1 N-acetylmannosamine kinase [Staphylococcus cohnii subsp. cohnii]MCI2940702.1 ROK family protein [Staphylococcus cohnii]
MHPYKIAIDIGGTEIKAAVVDQSLNFIEYIKTPTPNNIDTFIKDKIYNIVMTFQKSYQISPLYVGISSAGVIDERRGIVEYAGPTIPNYVNTDFKCLLKPINAQMNVFNDVNAALLGELVFHDYSAQNIFCLTLGTGIGGAFYNKYSQLYNGERNRANEIGYLLFDRQTNKTFEQRASTTALKTLMLEKGFIYQDNVPKLFELADQQDNLALSILNQWSDSIAEGIAQIQIIYDPGLILIGGGVSSQGQNLLKYIVPKVEHYLPEQYGHAHIQTSRTQNHAALYGAVSKF